MEDTIHAAFDRQVARSPHATAVVDATSGVRLSYVELQAAAVALGHRLQRAVLRRGGVLRRGTEPPGQVAAVLIRSSIERMVGYYGCLRAGLAFCPLEAGWPSAVCKHALALVRPVVLLVEHIDGASVAAAYEHCTQSGVPIVSFQQHPAEAEEEDRANGDAVAEPQIMNPTAHVIFTSGSSGQPKAVWCDHRGSLLSHYARVAAFPSRERRDDVFGCGVFGVWDAVAGHLHGSVAVMLPEASLRDAEQLAALLAVNDVTRMLVTPTLLDTLLCSAPARAALGLLDSLTLCGELPSVRLVARAVALLPRSAALINLYSSCECHDVAIGDLRAQVDAFALTPLPHVRIYITDEAGRAVAQGGAGSLFVGGDALAGGYLTAAPIDKGGDEDGRGASSGLSGKDHRFVRLNDCVQSDEVLPEDKDAVVCRTGDRAAVLSCSYCDARCKAVRFALAGREDAAVKVRGTLVATAAVRILKSTI